MNEVLNELRPRMMSVAYRMLGCAADAEDAVQEAFLRLVATGDVASPPGFLIKATTHRCIDRLRAKRRRERERGAWRSGLAEIRFIEEKDVAPEPLVGAFRLLLEHLTPNELAAYVLRTAFHYEYHEIADVLGKTPSHVRQIVCRASSRLLQGRPRFEPSPEAAEMLAEQFAAACRSGHLGPLEQLFVEDAEMGTGNVLSTTGFAIGARPRSPDPTVKTVAGHGASTGTGLRV